MLGSEYIKSALHTMLFIINVPSLKRATHYFSVESLYGMPLNMHMIMHFMISLPYKLT